MVALLDISAVPPFGISVISPLRMGPNVGTTRMSPDSPPGAYVSISKGELLWSPPSVTIVDPSPFRTRVISLPGSVDARAKISELLRLGRRSATVPGAVLTVAPESEAEFTMTEPESLTVLVNSANMVGSEP